MAAKANQYSHWSHLLLTVMNVRAHNFSLRYLSLYISNINNISMTSPAAKHCVIKPNYASWEM